MDNRALIEINEVIEKYMDCVIYLVITYRLDEDVKVISRKFWDEINTYMKKELVLAKYKEVKELYPESPLYGVYEDIYITLVEEDVTGGELEHELERFADDVIFRERSQNDLEQMILPCSVSKLDD